MRKEFLIAAAMVLGCGSPTSLATSHSVIDGQPLRLTLSVSKSNLRIGDPDTVRMTLVNEGSSTVVLNFNDSCQILAYIRNEAGRVVLPDAGGWGCYQVLTQLSLEPGAPIVREEVWTGGTAFASSMPSRPLPSGRYFVSAEVPAREGKLSTGRLEVNLR